jgi:galactose mutarotase-like enzyme
LRRKEGFLKRHLIFNCFHCFIIGYDGPNNPYFGSIIGRVANRIGKGMFHLGGQEYNVTLNKGTYHLHGGKKGFDKVCLTVFKFVY